MGSSCCVRHLKSRTTPSKLSEWNYVEMFWRHLCSYAQGIIWALPGLACKVRWEPVEFVGQLPL